MSFFNREVRTGDQNQGNQLDARAILQRTLSGKGRAEATDVSFRKEVADREARLTNPESEGQNPVEKQLAFSLNEAAKKIDVLVDAGQKEIDGYGQSAKSMHEVTTALTVFQTPKGEGLGLQLGRETLAGKAAEEAALGALSEALTEASKEEDYRQVATKAVEIVRANQVVWDQLTSHAKLDIQRKLHNLVLKSVAKHPLLVDLNIKHRVQDLIMRRVDALTPKDSLLDTYEELRQAVGVIRAQVVAEGGNAETIISGVVNEVSKETAGSTEALVNVARQQLVVAEESLSGLPEGALKNHFNLLIGEATTLVESFDEFDGSDAEKNAKFLELTKVISKRLSIFDAIRRGDAGDASVRLLLKMPGFAADLTVLIARVQKINEVGRVTVGGVDALGRKMVDAVDFIGREKGLVLEAGNEGTLRGVRERVRAFAQRAEEVGKLIDQLKNIDEIKAGNLDALESFRVALPFLRKVQTIAGTRNLSAIGVTGEIIPFAEQQPIIDLCINLSERAKSVEADGVRKDGQEVLLKIAIENIKQVYGLDDERAKALLTKEGIKTWFDKEKTETAPGLRGIHQRLVRRLRGGASSVEQGLLSRVSPGEMLGITLVDGEITLSQTGKQYAEALGRLNDAIGKDGELKVDADTLAKDIALLRSLRLKVQAGTVMDKIRNFITRKEIQTTASMKRLEQIQNAMENGLVLAAEVAAAAVALLAIKEGVEGIGSMIDSGMDNVADSLRSSLDNLRTSLSGAESSLAEAQSMAANNAQVDLSALQGDALEAARNAVLQADTANINNMQSGVDAISSSISSNQSWLERAQGFGQFGRQLAEVGLTNVAMSLGIAVGAAEANSRWLNAGTKMARKIRGLGGWMAGQVNKLRRPAEVAEATVTTETAAPTPEEENRNQE